MTYTSLLDDLRSYLERGSVEDSLVYAQLPRIVNLAERNIALEMKVQGLITAVSTTLTSGLAVYQKPARWRQTVSISIGTGTNNNTHVYLLPRPYEYCRSYWPDSTVTAQPQFYADYNYTNWLIAGTPDANYPAEIMCYQLPALLDDSTQTNWLTDYAPQVLLYGALLECAPYLKNDERIPVWKEYYGRALAGFTTEDMQKMIDRSAVRDKA